MKRCLILVCFLCLNFTFGHAQINCNNWLKTSKVNEEIEIGDLDISGTQLTVEALINRTAPYSPNDYRYAGDIVSKHNDPTDCNYLLRPTHAEITTTTGWHATPELCSFEFNKTYHIAMVYDGKTLKFYRNGFLMTQVNATGNLVTNDWLTTIGDKASAFNLPENMVGFINEVRIWNVARSQAEIRANMDKGLINPTSQLGLQAYYTFDNIQNKQGNPAWNGVLKGGAIINQVNTSCNFVADSCEVPIIIPNVSCNKVLLASYGGPLQDVAYDIVPSANGQFYLVGNTTSYGSGKSDILVMKFDQNKNIIWSNAYGFTGNETARKATAMSDGGLLITGQTKSFSNAAGDILCLRVDAAGNIVWTRVLGVGSTNGDLGSEIIPTADGGFALTGILNVAGDVADALVVKFNAAVNPVWSKRFNSNTGEDGSGIIEVGSKLIFTSDIEKQSGQDYGLCITELQTSDGAVINSRMITATTKGVFRPLIYKHPAGGYWISGHLLIGSSYAQMEQIILKTDANYGISKVYKLVRNPYTNNFYTGFSALPDGGFVTCASEAYSLGKGHVYRIDTNGKIVFSKKITAPQASSLNAVIVLGSKIFAGGSYTKAGNEDFYVADFDLGGNNSQLCNIDTSILSVQDHAFNNSAFTWPVVSDVSFGNIIQNLAKTPNKPTGIAICTKDTCINLPQPVIIDTVLSDIIRNRDTVICQNSSLQLNADSALTYSWSPATYLDNAAIANPTSKPLTDIKYQLIAKTLGINLVVNGNFTSGNSGFSSLYSYSSSGTNQGTYFVGANVSSWNSGMMPCNKDHTSGNGKMMLVNGANQAGVKVWSQNISVSPNTNYEFSCWLQNISAVNPAKLQFAINGLQIGRVFDANSVSCIWDRFSENWNSGTATTVEISIVNMNTESSESGFALDDISFAAVIYKKDSVSITIDRPLLKAIGDTSVCAGSTVQLKASGAVKYSWSPQVGLSNNLIANPLATIGDTSIRYVVAGFNANGCKATDTVNIGLLPAPVIGISNDTTICKSSSITLKASGGVSYNWSPDTSLDNPGTNNPTASPQANTLYHLVVTGSNGCKASDSVRVNIYPSFALKVSNDTSICPNSPIQLVASGALKYQWSPTSSLSNPAAANPTASPASTTTFRVIATDAQNCTAVDSVIVTTLAPPVLSISNDTAICSEGIAVLKAKGGLTYSWSPAIGLSSTTSSTTLASPGVVMVYKVEATGANSCKTTDSVHVNILPAPAIQLSKNVAICGSGSVPLVVSGGVSYLWSPAAGLDNPNISNPIASLTAAATYKVEVTGANGCIAYDSVAVSLYPKFTFKISNDTSVCPKSGVQLSASGGVSYKWSPSISLNNSGIASPIARPSVTTTYKAIATNTQNCTATDSVTVTVLASPNVSVSRDTAICKEGVAILKAGGGISYEWTPAAGLSDSRGSTTTASPGIATVYKVKVAGANSCQAVDSVMIGILPAPSLKLSKDTMICGVGSVALSASGGVTYAWSPALGLSDNLSPAPFASPTVSTTYQVKATGLNSCIATGAVLVNVFPPLISSISNDTAVCGVQDVRLIASGGTRYQWTPATGLSNSIIANPTASPGVSTNYTVKITNSNNCTAYETVKIVVNPLPLVSVTADTVICRQQSVQLLAAGGTSYDWTPALHINSTSIPNPLVSPEASTTYYVRITDNNNCHNIDSVEIALRPPPQFGVANTQISGCSGLQMQLQAFGGDSYSWYPTVGLSNPAIADPYVILQTSQTYKVTVSENICHESEEFEIPVTITPSPVIHISKSNDISCNMPTTQLFANISGSQFAWKPATGLSNNTIANPIAMPVTTTTYTLLVTADNGCSSSDSLIVKVDKNNDFRLYQVPNAFTPDGDGKNDCFGILKWGNVNIHYFQVFNRWGQLVFNGSNGNPCWSGSFKGIPQPSGNYVYRLEAETLCGVIERKGNVVLIR